MANVAGEPLAQRRDANFHVLAHSDHLRRFLRRGGLNDAGKFLFQRGE